MLRSIAATRARWCSCLASELRIRLFRCVPDPDGILLDPFENKSCDFVYYGDTTLIYEQVNQLMCPLIPFCQHQETI